MICTAHGMKFRCIIPVRDCKPWPPSSMGRFAGGHTAENLPVKR